MEKKINLSPKKIVNREFKVDFKGYNATEVDQYLDTIVEDYESFAAMLNEAYEQIDDLTAKNESLKRQIAELEKDKAVQEDSIAAMGENLSSNVDILKRLSLLEKAVFGNKGE